MLKVKFDGAWLKGMHAQSEAKIKATISKGMDKVAENFRKAVAKKAADAFGVSKGLMLPHHTGSLKHSVDFSVNHATTTNAASSADVTLGSLERTATTFRWLRAMLRLRAELGLINHLLPGEPVDGFDDALADAIQAGHEESGRWSDVLSRYAT